MRPFASSFIKSMGLFRTDFSLQLLALLILYFAGFSQSWVATSNNNNARPFVVDVMKWSTSCRQLRRRRFQYQQLHLLQHGKNNCDFGEKQEGRGETVDTTFIPLVDVTSSRRQWIAGCTAAAAAVIAAPPYGQAAAVSSSLSVVTSAATCDPAVSVWKLSSSGGTDDERLVYLLGTAHISSKSAEVAGQLVRDVIPQAVFVELDLKRVGGIAKTGGGIAATPGTKSAPNTNNRNVEEYQAQATATKQQQQIVVPVISSTATATNTDTSTSSNKGAAVGGNGGGNILQRKALEIGGAAVGNSVKGMYQDLDKAGFKPGEEFEAAILAGQEVGSAVVLGDQDVQITLRRLAKALLSTDLNKLLDPDSELETSMRELLPGPSDAPDEETAFRNELTTYVETIKKRESVRKIMGQLNDIAPQLVQVMLTERDAYMAAGLDTLSQFPSIVAVMGIAHMDGVEQNLRDKGWKQVPLKCKRR